jgi:hypothetical protein
MEIRTVGITYGELRSTGYPQFSNRRYEITLSARLEIGDTARAVQEKLTELAKAEVGKFFGDTQPSASVLDQPHRGVEELNIK